MLKQVKPSTRHKIWEVQTMSKDGKKKGYKVGYGKPPKNNRFGAKNGNPRNKKGRPKGRNVLEFDRLSEEALWDCFLQTAKTSVSITENGNDMIVPYIMALAKRMGQDAIKGDRHARKELLRMIEKATKGTDKILIDLRLALARQEDRRINSMTKPGSLEFYNAKYAHYMVRKHLRKVIGGAEFIYETGEPITDEDWATFLMAYELLKKNPDHIFTWPPEYPSTLKEQKYSNMSDEDLLRKQLEIFQHRKKMRAKEGVHKWPYMIEEPVDDEDWEHFTQHIKDRLEGKDNPTPWPPAYWDDDQQEQPEE